MRFVTSRVCRAFFMRRDEADSDARSFLNVQELLVS
jgi:hypothetical protein